jgi:hypothetical protein
MMTYDRILGFDPNGTCRIYASSLIEARQEARNYIRQQADTAPLAAWRFEFLVDTPEVCRVGAHGLDRSLNRKQHRRLGGPVPLGYAAVDKK